MSVHSMMTRQNVGRPASIAALAAKIQILEAELEAELAQRRVELNVGLERGRAFFEEEIYAAIAS